MINTEMEKGVVNLQNFVQRHYFGKYRAIVRKVDPKTGKIKAEVPALYGEKMLSPWAMPSMPFAGKKHGVVFLPEEGDGVWIEFEAGNPTVPIWSGFWWGENEKPGPIDEKVRGIITSSDLRFIMDDAKKEIALSHPGGAKITLSDKGITLEFKSASITLSSSGINMNNGAFEVK
jgi:CBS domain-containing protein